MGREIRRVPPDWEHPTVADEPRMRTRHDGTEAVNYQPLFDDDYDSAAEKWIAAMRRWEAFEGEEGETRRESKGKSWESRYYWEYAGGPPDPETYRKRKWTPKEATCYQVYETVSEGTPTSPVFKSLEEMEAWLVREGYSPEAAKGFCKRGYAFSMICADGKVLSDIESCSLQDA